MRAPLPESDGGGAGLDPGRPKAKSQRPGLYLQYLRAKGAVARVSRSARLHPFLRHWRGRFMAGRAWIRWQRLSLRGPLPDVAVVFGGHGQGGLGDDLLCSAVAHEIRRRTGRPALMLSRTPELFAGNPSVAAVLPPSPELFALLQARSRRLANAHYWDVVNKKTQRHLLASLCAHSGLSGEIALRPYLHLTPKERARMWPWRRPIVVQSSALNARWPSGNKEWYPDRMAEVVRRLAKDGPVVQLGHVRDPRLDGAVDLRGRTTCRQAAAILAGSPLFIGLVGFLMHLARAVDCRSVIIYGGNESPEHSGYPCNENLFTPLPCSPCLQFTHCDLDRACMQAIGADEVMKAVERLRGRLDHPLETASATLAGGEEAARS